MKLFHTSKWTNLPTAPFGLIQKLQVFWDAQNNPQHNKTKHAASDWNRLHTSENLPSVSFQRQYQTLKNRNETKSPVQKNPPKIQIINFKKHVYQVNLAILEKVLLDVVEEKQSIASWFFWECSYTTGRLQTNNFFLFQIFTPDEKHQKTFNEFIPTDGTDTY